MPDANTAISVAPLLSALTPIVVQVSGVLIAGAAAWAAARFHQATGITIQQGALDKLTTMTQAEAGALIAEASDNLAGRSITASSPMVADVANKIVRTMPEVLVAAGVTPSGVATMVAGHIGALQSGMPALPPPAAPKPS
jgi:hypothetical protein